MRCHRAVYAAEKVFYLQHYICDLYLSVDHWQVMTRAGLYHASCLACSHCARPLDPSSLLDTKEAVFCKPCYAVLRGTRSLINICEYQIIYIKLSTLSTISTQVALQVSAPAGPPPVLRG